MRQFIYGVIIGAALIYGWEKLDIPAVWAYLTSATDYAVKSTAGYR